MSDNKKISNENLENVSGGAWNRIQYAYDVLYFEQGVDTYPQNGKRHYIGLFDGRPQAENEGRKWCRINNKVFGNVYSHIDGVE